MIRRRLEPRHWRELIDLTPEHVDAIAHAWLDGPFPGWDALLDRLATANVKTACLSNTNARHWELMQEPGSTNFVPLARLTYRFASHQVRAHKPEPAIYEHVERATNVDPKAILFFDDLAANVAAARERDWSAEIIDTSKDPVEQVRSRPQDTAYLKRKTRILVSRRACPRVDNRLPESRVEPLHPDHRASKTRGQAAQLTINPALPVTRFLLLFSLWLEMQFTLIIRLDLSASQGSTA